MTASPAAPGACAAGRHDPVAVSRDAAGIGHARCRRCGCALRRLPVMRRWYRTGPMG